MTPTIERSAARCGTLSDLRRPGDVPYGAGMRWEQLFADLEAQLAAGRLADVRADVAELARAERASVTLADRVRASLGRRLRLQVGVGEVLEGELVDAAPEWLLLVVPHGRRALVPARAIVSVDGLAPHAAPAPGVVESRLGLGHVLRVLSRDRVAVRVAALDRELVGRIERVGADHVDVAELGPDGRPRGSWAVPFTALRVVRES